MNCPVCGTKATVVYSHNPTKFPGVRRRRHQCDKCGQRFTTYELLSSDLTSSTAETVARKFANRDAKWASGEDESNDA